VHALFERASGLTEAIIAAAIEVHCDKGPGLIESIYEWCLLKELGLRGLECVSQKSVLIEYKGFTREEPPTMASEETRRKKKMQQIRAIHQQTDPQMKAILSPVQYQKLQAIRQQAIREAMQTRHGG